MAALTETQLQSACRAKFPITVVRDEDYTTMTPAQIADAWTAYSGGTDGVYLKDTDDVWYAMDADLPKANGRGLLVFGGGKQYAQRCDFADCTVGQAFPASWSIVAGGTTILCSAKDTEGGVPFVEMTATGTPNGGLGLLSLPPGLTNVPEAEVSNGDIVALRCTVSLDNIPAQIYGCRSVVYQIGASPAHMEQVYYAVSTERQTITNEITDGNQAIGYSGIELRYDQALTALASPMVVKLFPSLISVNTAFPDHFHCLNTSTSAAATIVPEIMQRPAQLDKAWSMAIVASTGKRDLGGHQVIWCSSTDADNYVRVYRATSTGQITLHVRAAGVDYTKALGVIAISTTFRLSLRATAQVFTASLNGGAVQALAAPRPANLTAESLGHHYDGTLCGWSTIESLTTLTGIATDAQLIAWSTAA